MPGAARYNDSCTGHGCWPSRKSIQPDPAKDNPNVFINGLPAHSVNDKWASHTWTKKPHETHSGVLAAGAARVYVNGKQLGYIGAPISCGGSVATGSPDVIVNPA